MGRGRTDKYDYKMLLPMFEEFGKRDVKLSEIADIIGTTPSVLSRYQNKYPEIRQAYKRGKGHIVKALKSAALKTALDGNPQMQKYMLNNLTTYTEDKGSLIDQSTNITVINFGSNPKREVHTGDKPASNRSLERL